MMRRDDGEIRRDATTMDGHMTLDDDGTRSRHCPILPPLPGLVGTPHAFPRLAPWAGILRRCRGYRAAAQMIEIPQMVEVLSARN
jgi:hypothetical protein